MSTSDNVFQKHKEFWNAVAVSDTFYYLTQGIWHGGAIHLYYHCKYYVDCVPLAVVLSVMFNEEICVSGWIPVSYTHLDSAVYFQVN